MLMSYILYQNKKKINPFVAVQLLYYIARQYIKKHNDFNKVHLHQRNTFIKYKCLCKTLLFAFQVFT